MKNIAFYISGRRESMMRCHAIIDTLLRLEEELNIFVVSDEWAVSKLKKYNKEKERIHYYIEETDIRICLQEETGKPDWMATEKRVEEFIADWDELTEKTEEFLLENKIGLVISDICPWIFSAADNLRIKILLISDFTWDQVYKGRMSEAVWATYESCYEDAVKVIAYDLHQPELDRIAEDFEPVSLVSGPYDMEMIEQIRWGAGLPIVYLGPDIPVLKNLKDLPYYFILGGEQELAGVKMLPDEKEEAGAGNVFIPDLPILHMHNYIAASDYVIGRGDWDVAAFALLANKKAAYCKDEDARAEAKRIDILKERGQCIEILEEELADIPAVLKKLDALDYNYDMGYHNDDYEIAKMILSAYPKKRKRRMEE